MYKITIGHNDYELLPAESNTLSGQLNGRDYALDLRGDENSFSVIHNHKSYRVSVLHANFHTHEFSIRVNNNDYILKAKDRFELLLEQMGLEDLASASVSDLKAPMPGLVLSVEVEPGQEVSKGSPLVVLEAMKMENVLKAESDAVVRTIVVEKGQAVEKNQVLIEFEA